MQKEACAGAWHRLPFGRKMQKKGTVVSSAFPQPAAAETGVGVGTSIVIGIGVKRYIAKQ